MIKIFLNAFYGIKILNYVGKFLVKAGTKLKDLKK